MVAVTTRRVVAALAGPGIGAAREVYVSVPEDALRVAALVEISAAAAALARTIVKLRRLDPELVAPHVADGTDLRAVLGRGRWLPTMTRHVPAPARGSVDLAAIRAAAVVGAVSRRRSGRGAAGQRSLSPVAREAG